MSTVVPGLEVALAEGFPFLSGRRVGLITNHTAIDRRLRSAIDLLHASEVVDLVSLFGPEHGVRGDAQAGVKVGTSVDRKTGLPVHSLYGETQRPTSEMLHGLDALIFNSPYTHEPETIQLLGQTLGPLCSDVPSGRSSVGSSAGLSRRRSRVRVPSLALKSLQKSPRSPKKVAIPGCRKDPGLGPYTGL